MLIVIGVVGTLATWASIGYIDAERAHGHTDADGARLYGVLTPAFLAAMVVAVCANNIGVVWVAIEATTVVTAFLVGHRRTRTALEATWKYVIICSVGIAVAFLGTVLLYFAARHAGAPAAHALNFDVLVAHARSLDPGVARLAGGLLLIGYGAKAGLFPFHTWLADAHSQAPAPVSALMSGVLLSVAFSVLIRIKPIVDAATGAHFLRTGLLVIGLATLLVAALMLTVTGDIKRMLAYSSMENMGLIAIAAAAGTTLAIAALLLHVLAHGVGKTVLFLAGGQLQLAHDSTAIADITGVLRRSRLIGVSFAAGLIVLLGLPPFAMFASELAIARSLADARLTWVLAAGMLLIAIAFAALVRNASRMLLGPAAARRRRSPSPPAWRQPSSSASPPRSPWGSPRARSLTCSPPPQASSDPPDEPEVAAAQALRRRAGRHGRKPPRRGLPAGPGGRPRRRRPVADRLSVPGWLARPPGRARMRRGRERSSGAVAGVSVVPGGPLRTRNARPLRHPADRPSPAAPSGPARPLARRLASHARRRWACTGIRGDRPLPVRHRRRAPACTRSRSVRYTPV